MDERPRVVCIDDHRAIAAGLTTPEEEVQVVAAYRSVEDFLAAEAPEHDVVLLDLQLDDGHGRTAEGTHAVRMLVDAGSAPIVLYTSVVQEMVIAACLAAGATGAATKRADAPILGDVVRKAQAGLPWVDPLVAGALRLWGEQRHAGALSRQQADALRYRGQGLSQKAIAARIGVADPEIVNRYLKAAAAKLADLWAEPGDGIDEDDRARGAELDELAHRSGLASGLVRQEDIDRKQDERRRRSRRRRRTP